MKLAMTLLVKNEIDIIKDHIEYHLPKVDMLIVMDNCSNDGTFEYLESVKDDKLILLTQAAQNYNQSMWVTRMVNFAIRLKADWVINADADEFFVGDLKTVISKLANEGYNQIYPKGSMFYITDSKLNSFKNMIYRDPLTVKYSHDKVIHNVQGFVKVTPGNHWVEFLPIVKKSVIHTDEIRIFHYHVRSWQQFKNRYVNEFSEIKYPNMGHVWQQRYNIYKEKGDAGLKEVFENEYVMTEKKILERHLEKDLTLSKCLSSTLNFNDQFYHELSLIK
jgi:hypothetical protein